MNSNFNDEQIKAYAAAFEEGDAIWCDGKWWELSKLAKNSRELTCGSPNRYFIRCFDGKLAISGFKEEEHPYRVTTLEHYELQGGEKIVWLGKINSSLTFGKVYEVNPNTSYRDDSGESLIATSGLWAVIPRYEQVKCSADTTKKEPKFNAGDKVLVNGFINGTIVEVLGNQKYLVSIVFRSGVEEINEFNEYQLEPVIEELPAPKEENEQSSSNEIALDEVAIHSEIITRLVKQTIKGVKKYGDPVKHDNLSATEWIDHAIDESIDQIVYLTALKQSLMNKGDEK